MLRVISKDGTEIAYETKGSGPPVIFVDGAMGFRGLDFGNPLADLLSPHFMVYSYDRRGRGQSTNSKPYAIQREVEDIGALIQAAGGSADVYGISSGGCLALEAAIALGGEIKKLAIYEAPYNDDPASRQAWWDYRRELKTLLSAKRNGKAVALFMRFVGTPEEMVSGMQQSPMWPKFESVAPTLEYDADVMGENCVVPIDRLARVTSKTLVMDGGANLTIMPFMHASARTITKSIPQAQLRILTDQTHDVKAEVLAPVLIEFFSE
jgi:pimeloyl-ACP methyl ester carboxylesterase